LLGDFDILKSLYLTLFFLLQQLSNCKPYNFIIFLVKNIGRPPYRYHYTHDWFNVKNWRFQCEMEKQWWNHNINIF